MHTYAFSLQELYNINSPKANNRAQNCKTYRIMYKKRNPNRYIYLVKCKESYSSASGHLVSVRFKKSEDNKYPLTSEVRVKCSCPAWLYWGSDYNSTNEGYWLDTKQDIYPVVRDPVLENKICKHVARVRLDLRNMTFNKLDKKKKLLVQSSELLPVVSIDECRSAIVSFFESHKKDGGLAFFNSLTVDNFEDKLLEAGIID